MVEAQDAVVTPLLVHAAEDRVDAQCRGVGRVVEERLTKQCVGSREQRAVFNLCRRTS